MWLERGYTPRQHRSLLLNGKLDDINLRQWKVIGRF